jgi:hypothetical protein
MLAQRPVAGMARVSIGDVTALAPAGKPALAAALAEAAEPPQTWLGLGQVDLTPLTIIAVPDARSFGRLSGGALPGWGAGFAIPSRRLVVVRLDAGDPFAILRHELAHLALHRRVPGRLPLWFSEGYAVLASGELDRLAALQLNVAVVRGRVPGLTGLDAALRGRAGDAETAYALAGAAVAELARRHPTGSLEPLLDRLADGQPFDAAIQATTGLTLDRFDEAWHLSVRRRYNWGLWLLTGGVWGLVALLVVGLGVWRRWQDAPRRAALDRGWTVPEEMASGDPLDDESITVVTNEPDQLDPPAPDR